MRPLTEIICVFRIQFLSLRAEAGPFFLAGILFPASMYLFARAVSAHNRRRTTIAYALLQAQ